MHEKEKNAFRAAHSLRFLTSSAWERALPAAGWLALPRTEATAFPLNHLNNKPIENQVTGLQNQDNNKIIMIL